MKKLPPLSTTFASTLNSNIILLIDKNLNYNLDTVYDLAFITAQVNMSISVSVDTLMYDVKNICRYTLRNTNIKNILSQVSL